MLLALKMNSGLKTRLPVLLVSAPKMCRVCPHCPPENPSAVAARESAQLLYPDVLSVCSGEIIGDLPLAGFSVHPG